MKPRSADASALLTLLLIAGALFSSPLAAWTPATQVAIAESAASIAPPDLARQIARHRQDFRRGVVDPFQSADEGAHVKNATGRGTLDRTVDAAAASAVSAIATHRPFSEIVYRLGVLSHFVADANNPMNASDSDPREGSYFADYLRYVDSARERYPIVFYGNGRDLRDEGDLRSLLATSLDRGRGFYPLIASEYQRIGRIDGIELFDDRSTAFAIGSLAVSHAVSDVAATLRYVWLQAGGGDRRSLGLTRPRDNRR